MSVKVKTAPLLGFKADITIEFDDRAAFRVTHEGRARKMSEFLDDMEDKTINISDQAEDAGKHFTKLRFVIERTP